MTLRTYYVSIFFTTVLVGVGVLVVAPTSNALTPVSMKISSNIPVVTNGLVGYWTFDGPDMVSSTTVRDKSGNSNAGILVNNLSKTAGKVGQALTFNGTNQYVVSTNTLPTLTTYTTCAWVKPNFSDANTSVQTVITRKSSPGDVDRSSVLMWDGTNNRWISDSRSAFAYSLSDTLTPFNSGQWHHICFSFGGSGGTGKFYWDGVSKTTTQVTYITSANNTASKPFYIGTNVSSEYFNGAIDDVRVYNRALTASEVSKLFNANKVTLRSTGLGTTTIRSVQAPSFTCGTSNVTDADGNIYNTLQIGSQCWMKQNMRVGTRINASTAQSNNGTIEKYCYSDTGSNCTSNNPNQPDGGLYQWNEAMQYSTTPGARGICPVGWHIPTHDQLTTLERAVCTSGSCATDFPYDTTTTGYRGTNEGTKLKPSGTSGFEANLAGTSFGASFYYRGASGYVWSSSESGTNAWFRYVFSAFAQVYRNAVDKSGGCSVRCLKDS